MWDRIKLLTSDIWQHLQPVLLLFLTTLGKQLLLSALAAVRAAASQPNLSSREKREFAYEMIKGEIDGAQDRAINLAIEIAVNKLTPSGDH